MTKELNEPNSLVEDIKKLEVLSEKWHNWLSITTTGIVVLAASVTLVANYYCDAASFKKTDASIYAAKAAGQWQYFQAKSIKEAIARQNHDAHNALRYKLEQICIKQEAERLEDQVKTADAEANALYETHHSMATGIVLLQTAIASCALSAVLKKKRFWILSILLTAISLLFLW